ncbi:hypothetical protein [Oceanobacillus saliphilus]|uniref:hypothetical protein n=1 Tax=Oceanobacillus saliphilus TaxID=2925834 RepID=UPI00201E4D07|nr:hypothetical protein [Oceanobacillus saliphilus]
MDYMNPEFYTYDYRKQFDVVDKVKINTMPTLEIVKDYYEVHMFSHKYIGL